MAERQKGKIMEKLNSSFKVGENLYEIKPTEEEYRYLLVRNNKFLAFLDGTVSTAFSPAKVRFECSSHDFLFSFSRIAIQDAISLLEAHYNSEI